MHNQLVHLQRQRQLTPDRRQSAVTGDPSNACIISFEGSSAYVDVPDACASRVRVHDVKKLMVTELHESAPAMHFQLYSPSKVALGGSDLFTFEDGVYWLERSKPMGGSGAECVAAAVSTIPESSPKPEPFDTTWLLGLRILSDNMLSDTLEPRQIDAVRTAMGFDTAKVSALQDARRQYAAIQCGASTEDDKTDLSLKLFCKVWVYFHDWFCRSEPASAVMVATHKQSGSLEGKCEHALYLPLINTETDGLHQLLTQLVCGLRARELHNCVFPIGHAVISGVEGTDKTTVVKALAMAIAVCCPHIFLVYVDYTNTSERIGWTVPRLLQELYDRLLRADVLGTFGSAPSLVGFTEPLSSAVLLRMLRDKFGVWVAFAADEVQKLVSDQASSPLNGAVIDSLEYYARNLPRAWIILTGSCTNLRPALCAAHFNRSLCTCYYMIALRSNHSLGCQVAQQYKLSHLLEGGEHEAV